MPFLQSHRPFLMTHGEEQWQAMSNRKSDSAPAASKGDGVAGGRERALFLTTMGSFVTLHTVWFHPLDLLLCIHWDDSGPKRSQRAKVRHYSGGKKWLVLIKGFFPPALELAELSLLLTLWRITTFLLTQMCVLSFPSPSTYANHPPLGSFTLLPGSCSLRDLRISSVLLPACGRIAWHWTCSSCSLEESAGGILVSPFLFFALLPLWDRQPFYKQAWGLNTESHNMVPLKCAEEDIFQAVTACTLWLAAAGERKELHHYRKARAEIIS